MFGERRGLAMDASDGSPKKIFLSDGVRHTDG
jgi:hypothetical protein